MVCRKSNRALTYRKLSEWKLVAWYENMTTWTLNVLKAWTTGSPSSEYYKLCSVAKLAIRHDSTRIERLVTANDDPSYRMSICRRRHGPPTFLEREMTGSQLSCKSTSGMTGLHLLWRVVRFGNFWDTCGIFSKCLANLHPEWRVVICCDESFDLSPFVPVR